MDVVPKCVACGTKPSSFSCVCDHVLMVCIDCFISLKNEDPETEAFACTSCCSAQCRECWERGDMCCAVCGSLEVQAVKHVDTCCVQKCGKSCGKPAAVFPPYLCCDHLMPMCKVHARNRQATKAYVCGNHESGHTRLVCMKCAERTKYSCVSCSGGSNPSPLVKLEVMEIARSVI